MKTKLRPSSYAWLFAGAIFFIFPIIAAAEFSLRRSGAKTHDFSNYTWAFGQTGFGQNLWTSFRLAALTAILVLILMVPTVVYTHLGGKTWKRTIEFLCLVPLVVPVVSYAIGAVTALPTVFQSTLDNVGFGLNGLPIGLGFLYVIISLPYTYRSLDVGLSSVPLETLVEASRSIGATFGQTLRHVIVPSIRSAVNGAIFMAMALSLGEFTLAVLMHFDTFPTWIANVSQDNVLGAIALSVFALVGALFIVLVVSIVPNLKRKSTTEEQE
jgi:putative spermidine/putrescine transport system permease protein